MIKIKDGISLYARGGGSGRKFARLHGGPRDRSNVEVDRFDDVIVIDCTHSKGKHVRACYVLRRPAISRRSRNGNWVVDYWYKES